MSGIPVKGEYILQTVTWREDREAQARGLKELIRCKECKWAVKCYGDVVMVDKYGEEIHEPLGMNGYCSMAEREEE